MDLIEALWRQLQDRLLDGFDIMAASPLAPWIAAAFVATAFIFFRTAWDRHRIDQALTPSGVKPLKLFDLSSGDTEYVLTHKAKVAPERLWTYDEEYLEDFANKAKELTVGQRSVLDLYVESTLHWDMAFAVALAGFTALFWFAIAFADWAPLWLGRLALFCGCMGILYGAADLAEDCKLVSILRHPDAVDPAEAAAANVLTRIKFVTITLSLVAALLFAVLSTATTLWWELDGLIGDVVSVALARLRGARTAPTATPGQADPA